MRGLAFVIRVSPSETLRVGAACPEDSACPFGEAVPKAYPEGKLSRSKGVEIEKCGDGNGEVVEC